MLSGFATWLVSVTRYASVSEWTNLKGLVTCEDRVSCMAAIIFVPIAISLIFFQSRDTIPSEARGSLIEIRQRLIA